MLVILGLLTGSILAGRSLIHAAELRAVSSEYSRYYTATQAFKDKYFALPGDLREGTRFWGLQFASGAYSCGSNAGITTVTANGTCDSGYGGDGVMGWNNASRTSELFQFWRQLALAGLIEGSFTGVTATSSYCAMDAGINTPLSKYSNGTWAISININGGGLVNWTPPGNVNSYVFGAVVNVGSCYAANTFLPPEDAWNVDTKMDDGKPGTGLVRGTNFLTCVTGSGAGAAAAAAATYNLASSTGCYLEFTKGLINRNLNTITP